tara:strand:- start:12 stop:272 length:261 start_codon:yes stop_codon:yes gene_type:complete
MRNKLLLIFIFIFGPISLLQQPSSRSSINCKVKNNLGLFLTDTSGYKSINELFNCSEKQAIMIKDCWQKGDLASQKRYCNSKETHF